MKKKSTYWAYRIVLYLFGLALLAAGIVLSKKISLGISPIVSVADCASQLLIGKISWLNLANATLVEYIIFVIAEMIIHTIRKQYKEIPFDAMQIVVSLVFTQCMTVFDVIPSFTGESLQGTFYATMAGRLIFLIIAVILTGTGVSIALSTRLVPNPGDGIVRAISECIKKSVGLTKNIFDISCVTVSTVVGLIFTHSLVSVGIGTVVAMIGVGRVVALVNKLCKKQIEKLCGYTEKTAD